VRRGCLRGHRLLPQYVSTTKTQEYRRRASPGHVVGLTELGARENVPAADERSFARGRPIWAALYSLLEQRLILCAHARPRDIASTAFAEHRQPVRGPPFQSNGRDSFSGKRHRELALPMSAHNVAGLSLLPSGDVCRTIVPHGEAFSSTSSPALSPFQRFRVHAAIR